MANTKSAKKNIRSSARKKAQNIVWKEQIRDTAKSLKMDISRKDANKEELLAKLKALQKAVDKAAKEKVIHKNRANRLKSMYARKITALLSAGTGKTATKRSRK